MRRISSSENSSRLMPSCSSSCSMCGVSTGILRGMRLLGLVAGNQLDLEFVGLLKVIRADAVTRDRGDPELVFRGQPAFAADGYGVGGGQQLAYRGHRKMAGADPAAVA